MPHLKHPDNYRATILLIALGVLMIASLLTNYPVTAQILSGKGGLDNLNPVVDIYRETLVKLCP